MIYKSLWRIVLLKGTGWLASKPSCSARNSVHWGRWVSHISHTYMLLWSDGCYAQRYLGNSTELSLMRSVACGSFTLQMSCEITGRKAAWAQCQCQVSASHCQLWLGRKSRGLLIFSRIPMCSLSFAHILVHTDKSSSISLSALFSVSGAGQFSHAGTSSLYEHWNGRTLTGWGQR